MNNKVKSFTLSELLVVMIITAIVVGMAFSVLRLVQKQIHTIQKTMTNQQICLYSNKDFGKILMSLVKFNLMKRKIN